MLNKRWVIALVAVATVVGILIGASFGLMRGQFAHGRSGHSGPAYGQMRPETVPSEAAPDALVPSERGHGHSHMGHGSRGMHGRMGSGFGWGLARLLGGLLQLAIVVVAVAWLSPKVSQWWGQRPSNPDGGNGEAIPPHKEEPPVA